MIKDFCIEFTLSVAVHKNWYRQKILCRPSRSFDFTMHNHSCKISFFKFLYAALTFIFRESVNRLRTLPHPSETEMTSCWFIAVSCWSVVAKFYGIGYVFWINHIYQFRCWLFWALNLRSFCQRHDFLSNKHIRAFCLVPKYTLKFFRLTEDLIIGI